MQPVAIPHVQIAIIGSGFGGLGAAIRLKQAGFHKLVIFERAGDVGGVWRDNHYPGAACDVESHLYSFSFAPNPHWTHNFSSQSAIWAYLQQCAKDFGLLPHIRFYHTVYEAVWEQAAGRWQLETSQGSYTASVLVMATGGLSEPAVPTLPGLDRFTGVTFHSANWNDSFDLTGQRVAVIGTGASAIQFVPAIQPLVGQLYLFQRTAPWILPRGDRQIGKRSRWLFHHLPLTQRLARAKIYAQRELEGIGFRKPHLMETAKRIALRHLEGAVSDPVLRAKLTPKYTVGCKRILISDTYYPALTQPNVEVVTSGIAEVRTHALVDQAGIERSVDAIIFGTGFQVTNAPFGKHVRGREGRSLAEVWNGSPKAYLGTTVAEFPNLFILQGPNTGLGHTSVIYMLEAQIDHIVAALRYMKRNNIASVEPRSEAQAAFIASVDADMQRTVWMVGGCSSWYLDATGRNSTLWPTASYQFRRRVARFVPNEYQCICKTSGS